VVIQEARQAGARVLVADIGGMAEKAEGWGMTFRAGDPADLADRILRIAATPDAAARDLAPVRPAVSVDASYRALAALLSARAEGRLRRVF